MEENNKNELDAQTATATETTDKTDNGKKKKSLGREILEWVEAIALAVIVAVLVRSFIFTVVRVDGKSMLNTLADNDRLIVWRLGYEPKQGDIVVFAPDINVRNDVDGMEIPNSETSMFKRVYWVKRVIATEGQSVEINYDENAVYVDGIKLDEPYLDGLVMEERGTHNYINAVPKGCVFLLGDNRNNSSDSRVIGPVKVKSIVGKAVLRFWPLGSFGTVTHNN